MHHPTDRITHTTAFVTPVAAMINSSMGSKIRRTRTKRIRTRRTRRVDTNNKIIIRSQYVGRKEMFYLTTHSTHFIYGYMASDIW